MHAVLTWEAWETWEAREAREMHDAIKRPTLGILPILPSTLTISLASVVEPRHSLCLNLVALQL